MTGATGYIGKHLSSYLTEKGGHRVIPLGRSMFREGMSGLLIQTLAHCDVVINLAGAPINKRWTPEYKQELFNSRIVVTHRIVRALNAVKTKPKLMISASAVGYYPPEVEADEYTRTRGKASCPTFAMRGRKRRNAVPNLHGSSLPALVSCSLPTGERCSRCYARCRLQRWLPLSVPAPSPSRG